MATKKGAAPIATSARPRCSPRVTYVDYKDVDLLRTFISDRGQIRSRRVTGLTPQQQDTVARAIKRPLDGATAILIWALTPLRT